MIFYLISLLIFSLHSQDERFYQKLHPEKKKENIFSDYNFHAYTPLYQLDLDEDGRDESLMVEMRDGGVWIIIRYKMKKIKEFELDVNGVNPKVYRITMSRLSSKSKIMLVRFYEGYNPYPVFRATARLYFITWEDNDLKTLSLFKGPLFFHEFKGDDYYTRDYKVSLFDFNKDGIKEVSVDSHLISKVWIYKGKGRWIRP